MKPTEPQSAKLTRTEAAEGVRRLTRLLLEAQDTVAELFETQELIDWLDLVVVPLKNYKLTADYKYALDKYLAYVAVFKLSA
jgi:hypothetical protein